VREYARNDQFVTTCISYNRPQVSDDELVGSLDVTAGNPYYKTQDGLDASSDIRQHERWWHASVWALFEWGDRAFSSAQSSYLVTETDAQSIGAAWQNHPPFPGQLRQAAFALLARGGRMIEYWHWHTLHFGTETYWGGVIPHSGVPGRIYREVSELGAELRAIGTALDDFVPDADVLFIYSTDTKWLFEATPPLADDAGGPDSDAYLRIFDAFYRGLFDVGAQVRIQHPRQFVTVPAEELAARYPVLVAPALYVADDAVLRHLSDYAAAGGHLVIGIRTGYGDELARARNSVAPGPLAEAARLHYDEYSNLDAPLPVTAIAGGITLEPGAAGLAWVDILNLDGAEALASFAPTELGAEAAVTSAPFGTGRVSYVATVPNPELGRSLGRWLVPETAHSRWTAGDAVTVSSGVSEGHRIVFLSNWSATPTTVVAPHRARDLVSDAEYSAGDAVLLEGRSAVVLEATGDSTE
jgi:beta-galactosidase